MRSRDHRHLVLATGAGEDGDGTADHLPGGVAEEALRGPVPAGNQAVQVLAGDRVVAAVDDRGQERSCQALGRLRLFHYILRR